MENPRVLAEVRKIMGFYLQLGICGFRMDAIPFVIEGKSTQSRKPMNYDLLRDFRQFLQWRSRDAIILAEANVEPRHSIRYFGEDGERLQMMFNFWVNQNAFLAMATGDTKPLARALEQTRDRPANGQWGHFMRNHDELDLGRLTERQRQAIFDAMAPEPDMQLYERGIRRRLAPMLHGDTRRLQMAYSLMFALPGTPVLRYGDELGMGDRLDLPERDCARTPMQWSGEAQAGFSHAAKLVRPVIDKGPYAYTQVNVADQRRDPESLLNWTARMIRLRKELPEIGWGEYEVLDAGRPGVLGLRYTWRNNSVVILHNLTDESGEISLPLPGERNRQLVNLLTGDHSHADGRGTHRIIMEPYGYHWYRAGGLGYLLDRETV
jgi:maltose alpha-D-glucosyltransferase / alpha-amylase